MGLSVFLRIALVGFLTFDLIGDAYAQRYCSQNVRNRCGRNRRPSACIDYRCGGRTSYGHQGWRNFMVDRHNRYRRDPCLGRYGGNMIRIQWNFELEEVSYRWLTNMCQQGGRAYHDEFDCRCSPDFDNVGQNIWGAQGDYRLGDMYNAGGYAMQSWYYQRQQVTDPRMVFPYHETRGRDYSSYTQMMWAESYEVGCAYIATQNWWGVTAYVACNYARSGNRINYNMFDPFSDFGGGQCTPGTRRASDGFCDVYDEGMLRRHIHLNRTG